MRIRNRTHFLIMIWHHEISLIYVGCVVEPVTFLIERRLVEGIDLFLSKNRTFFLEDKQHFDRIPIRNLMLIGNLIFFVRFECGST